MLILCVCVCVCLSVSLSPVRSREWNIVSLRFFCRRNGILLVSYTNCLSSLYDTWFERKSLWNFSAGYALEAVHACYTSWLPWAGWILPTENRWNILEGYRYHSWYCFFHEQEVDYTIKNQPVRERVTTITSYYYFKPFISPSKLVLQPILQYITTTVNL